MGTQGIIGAVKRRLKKLAGSKVGKAVAKVPSPIRKGWLAGALVPVPGAAETGALIGAAVHGKDLLERAVRARTGAPYRVFETPGRQVLELMGFYKGGDPGKGAVASEKLDGVYAKATRAGVFSKSGKPLDVPHVSKRLGRYFRKHPDGELEGELWRKGEGVEKIAGAAKSGGKAAKRLRLHLYPGQEDTPWPIGAVRRVKGRAAETEAEVDRLFRKVVKRGGEGVVIRQADGTAVKKKPREDAEWEVAGAPGGKRGVLVLKDGDRTFKVQSRSGVEAAPGDRVRVSYSGKTAKGRPKAAVAERVRNDTDFEDETEDFKTEDTRQDMKMTRFETPAVRILGDPCARVLFGARRMSAEEEIERDRRTLKRIAIGGLAAGMGAGLLWKRGKRMPVKAAVKSAPATVAVKPVEAPKVMRTKRTERTKRGVPVMAASGKGRVALETPAERMGIEFREERRDGLSKVRDVAIIGATGAVGTGALVAAHQARKLGKDASVAVNYAASGISRAARKMKDEVTPEAVAREGGRLVKRKLKQKASEYFPTFTKWGKKAAEALRKTFQTPAELMGIEFAGGAAGYKLRDDDRRFVDHVDVAWGKKRAYDQAGKEVKVGVGDPAVVKSYLRKAETVNKWGGRGGRVLKDAADVIQGTPRGRDASGRKKKREWEKPWAENAAKKALLAGGLAAYGIGYKNYQPLRVAHKQAVRKGKKALKNIQRALADFDAKTEDLKTEDRRLEFVTPAVAMGIEFAGKKRKPEGDPDSAARAAIGGGLVGGANGAVIGGLSSAMSKEADGYFDLKNRHAAASGQGGVLVAGKEARPFKGRGRFGKTERLARAQYRAGAALKKTVRNRMLGGTLAGAAILGGGGYLTEKVRQKEKRFETPAEQMGIEFDQVAADAGWDIRDPRGKSARVFAPGARKRIRREKAWHEEVDNERKLWKAGTAAALLAGGTAGLLIGRKLPKKPKTGVGLGPVPKAR